jgi:hypothetical protein
MRSKTKVWILGAAAAGVALVAMIGAALDGPEAKAASCARGTKRYVP